MRFFWFPLLVIGLAALLTWLAFVLSDIYDERQHRKRIAVSDNMYDIARKVTDDVMGEGTYAEINAGDPDPGVQRAIRKWKNPDLMAFLDWCEFNGKNPKNEAVQEEYDNRER